MSQLWHRHFISFQRNVLWLQHHIRTHSWSLGMSKTCLGMLGSSWAGNVPSASLGDLGTAQEIKPFLLHTQKRLEGSPELAKLWR